MPMRASFAFLVAVFLLALGPVGTAAPGVGSGAAADAEPPTFLITGSNRGVGLALARVYAGRGWNVIATARSPGRAGELKALAASNARVSIERLDVTEDEDIERLARRLGDRPIDVLFHNAGILGTPLGKQQFGGLDEDLFEDVMETNVLGPLKLSEALVGNVAASGQKKIIGMTSGLGSLTLMGSMSRFYYYQMSKAALNMGMRALRNDLRGRGITVALLAPGMVDTGLLEESGFRGEALTPAESAEALYGLVEALGVDDPGKPVNVDGKVIPW